MSASTRRIALRIDPRASEVEVTDDESIVILVDGRRIAVPLAWFPGLLHASPSERSEFELNGRFLAEFVADSAGHP